MIASPPFMSVAPSPCSVSPSRRGVALLLLAGTVSRCPPSTIRSRAPPTVRAMTFAPTRTTSICGARSRNRASTRSASAASEPLTDGTAQSSSVSVSRSVTKPRSGCTGCGTGGSVAGSAAIITPISSAMVAVCFRASAGPMSCVWPAPRGLISSLSWAPSGIRPKPSKPTLASRPLISFTSSLTKSLRTFGDMFARLAQLQSHAENGATTRGR